MLEYTVTVERPDATVVVESPSTTVAVEQPALTVTVDPSDTTLLIVDSPAIDIDVWPSGAQGPPGVSDALIIWGVAAHVLSGHRVVTADDDGLVRYASADAIGDVNRPMLFITQSAAENESVQMVMTGRVTEPGWAWTPGLPVWLGLAGVPTQIQPGSGLFWRRLGHVINPTTLIFDPEQPLVKG